MTGRSDNAREARVGAGPVESPTPIASAADLADVVRQVRIDHMPALEDDDQGPFLHFSDAAGIALACWPRIAVALASARAAGAAEAFERAAKRVSAHLDCEEAGGRCARGILDVLEQDAAAPVRP